MNATLPQIVDALIEAVNCQFLERSLLANNTLHQHENH